MALLLFVYEYGLILNTHLTSYVLFAQGKIKSDYRLNPILCSQQHQPHKYFVSLLLDNKATGLYALLTGITALTRLPFFTEDRKAPTPRLVQISAH